MVNLPNWFDIQSVVVCTDLRGKELHRQVDVGIGRVMVAH